MSTPSIKAALRAKYCATEWAIMFEVRDATGFEGKRSADAVAMNLWPSRGMAVHGFEIKASRGDWQRELAQPEKSDPVQQYCDHWWIVAMPGIVKSGELPPTWGLQELHGERLVLKSEAPKLAAAPLSRGFVASMLRRTAEADDAQIKLIVDKRVAEERKYDEAEIERKVERRARDRNELLAKVEKIKAETGIDLTDWTPGEDIARAIRAILKSGLSDKHGGISSIVESMEQTAAKLREFSECFAPKMAA